MKLSLALLTALSSSLLVSGFTIPADQPDGVYEVSIDSNGEYVHTKVADPTDIAPENTVVQRSRITKRSGLDQIYCFNQDVLNSGDTDAANANLDSQCGPNGHGVGSHLSVYAKRGGTVAYCCNNRSQGNTCYASTRQQASRLITDKCGRYVPGAAYDSGAHLTYGYQGVNYNFCPSS